MDGWRDGRRDGRRDRYLYIIDCLRQVVAFAPKVIKCAYGAIKGNKMRRLRRRTRKGVEVWVDGWMV